jgi:CMP/dCMP kinase
LLRRQLVVAIDGPSGAGKSTVARQVATALDLRYLDTGAMYRAITWLALRRGVGLDAHEWLTDLAEHAVLEVVTDPNKPAIMANGVDVSRRVRSESVTNAVSAVSAVPGVRRAMVARQRDIIGDGGIVVEGRDIGTTVAPSAPIKIFLTASAQARASRRSVQDGRGDGVGQVATTQAELARRDRADSTRVASPLHQPEDALVIDSSRIGVDEVVAVVLERAREVVDE